MLLQHLLTPDHTVQLLSVAAQHGIGQHVLYRHAGGTQTQQEGNPALVVLAVAAVAAGAAAYRVYQPDVLVIAQGMGG
jgi:uncharacterized protein YaaW (UPF0174 family)